jgi:hypothetical protein
MVSYSVIPFLQGSLYNRVIYVFLLTEGLTPYPRELLHKETKLFQLPATPPLYVADEGKHR